MRGQRVERRFGWDCHGLPVEMQAEQELGLSGRVAIEAYGVDKFNERCRAIVGHDRRRLARLRHPPGPLGRHGQRLQDHGPLVHGVGHVGAEAALRQGPALRGLPRAAVLLGVRDAAVQLRDRASTTPTATARTPPSPSGSSSTTAAACWCGRRRRGRCRRTSRSPSVPTSTTPSTRKTAGSTSSARHAPAPTNASSADATQVGNHQGRRARRPPLHAAVRLLRRSAERVRGPRRRLRDDRGRHRHRAHGPRLRRGRPARRARRPASPSSRPSTRRAGSRARWARTPVSRCSTPTPPSSAT